MLMENFGGTNKEYYGIFESGLFAQGGGTPLFGLYGFVPLDRVYFFGVAVLNRV